jgi:TonB family protein
MRKNLLLAVAGLLLALCLIADVAGAQDPAPDGRAPSTAAGQDNNPYPGAYRVGGGVSAPKPLYAPDPEYSEKARKAKFQGTVVLWLVVDANGLPQRIRVQSPLGMGLDEQAIAAVQKWRFEPSKKDGKPVPVMINVEVNFRLYDELKPHPESNRQPPGFPGVDTSEYPLVVRLLSGQPPAGDTMNYTATVEENGQQRQVSISCSLGSAHCLALQDGAYPARWRNDKSTLEILGLFEQPEKWYQAEYVLAPDVKNSQEHP